MQFRYRSTYAIPPV
ncbi:hypothetical protein [uncultured Subdoligranulum sp.]